MNKELLLKIKEQVLAHPEHLDMTSGWISLADGTECYAASAVAELIGQPEKLAACGATACIAGWAVVLSPEAEEDGYIRNLASKLLGLTYGQSDNLFFVSGWPRQFGELYHDTRTPQERAQVVAERIDHFIATEGAE